MTDRNVRRSAVVGLVVVAVLAAVTFSIGGLRIFERTYEVAAVFDSASGVGGGDPVRVAGVDVGRVTAVERQLPAGTVRVVMSVDRAIALSEATRASIRLRTLLGKKYVDLADPGVGPRLADGGEIPLDRTIPATDVDTLLNSAQPVIERVDVDAVNAVVRSLDGALDGRGEELGQLLGDLQHLTTVLAERRADIDRLVVASDRLSAVVDTRRQSLASSVDGFATVLDTLARRRADLSGLVGAVRDLSQRLTPLLERNQTAIGDVVRGVESAADVLDGQRSRLDIALDQLPKVVERFFATTREGSWVNVYAVGLVATPYLANPVDTGASQGGEPGRDGGLPRLWVRPPAQLPSQEMLGSKVDTGDNSPTPPEGYPGQ
jgi:phospholipid/cholesterol/gamma-HCH transport system substrate-binding protein